MLALSAIVTAAESADEIVLTVVISPFKLMVTEPPESVEVVTPLPPDILSSSVPPCRYIPVESSATTLNIVSLASACLVPPAVEPSCRTSLPSSVSTDISPLAPVKALF